MIAGVFQQGEQVTVWDGPRRISGATIVGRAKRIGLNEGYIYDVRMPDGSIKSNLPQSALEQEHEHV